MGSFYFVVHVKIEVLSMALNQRQTELADLVHEKDFITIDELAQHFSVTPQTIRETSIYSLIRM
jgi:hypothetical protein